MIFFLFFEDALLQQINLHCRWYYYMVETTRQENNVILGSIFQYFILKGCDNVQY